MRGWGGFCGAMLTVSVAVVTVIGVTPAASRVATQAESPPVATVTLACGSDVGSRTITSFDATVDPGQTARLYLATPQSGGVALTPLAVGDEIALGSQLQWSILGVFLGPWPVDSVSDNCTHPQPDAIVTLGCGDDVSTRRVSGFDADVDPGQVAQLYLATPQSGGFRLTLLSVGDEIPLGSQFQWRIEGIFLGPWPVDAVNDGCTHPQPDAVVTLGCAGDDATRTVASFDPDVDPGQTARLYLATPQSGGVAFTPLAVGDVIDVGSDLMWAIEGVFLGPWPVDLVMDDCTQVITSFGPGAYVMIESDGQVYGFGAPIDGWAPTVGSTNAGSGSVAIDVTADGLGAWVLHDDGTVTILGSADHHGDLDLTDLSPGEQPSTLSATPDGGGYWIFTDRGRAVAFGNAVHFGDMSGVALNGPVVASTATPSGLGYYMVATDGGVFAFGDAVFRGSMGGVELNRPVNGIVPDRDGDGYWLVASDGGIFAFEAPFLGSMGSVPLNGPVVGAVAFGDGYLLVGSDGGIFNFSGLDFLGSLGATPPDTPILGVAAHTTIVAVLAGR